MARTERSSRRARFALWLGVLAVGCVQPPKARDGSVGHVVEGPDRSGPDGFRYEQPAAGTPLVVEFPVAESVQLSNGFTLWAFPTELSTVSLELSCRVGSDTDPPGKSGLASLMTRLLTEGTRDQTALQQAIRMESLGTALGHDTSHDLLGLDAEVLPQHVAKGVAGLAEALRFPGLREEDFQRVKSERLDDLRNARQDPDRLAWLFAQRALLGPVYGRSVDGSPKEVAQLQREDVVSFHRQWIVPERCGLLVAGSADFGALRSVAEEVFGTWPAGDSSAAPTDPRTDVNPTPAGTAPGGFGGVIFHEREDAVQSTIVLGRLLPPRSAPGHEARQLVSNLFGGLFTSRLNTNLRERHGYTYGAFSSVSAARNWGALFTVSSVRTEVSVPAFEQMKFELRRLGKEPPSRAEIDSARTDLIQRQLARLEHGSRLIGSLEESFGFELPTDHFHGFAARLRGLEAKELRATAEAFPEAAFVSVIVGDHSVAEALAKAGVSVQRADRSFIE